MTKIFHAILLTGIMMPLASAQTLALNGQGSHLSKGDPSLYSSFVFFVEDFSAWLDARWTAEPARKVILAESAARYLKVEPTDLPRVTATCRSVAAVLRRIDIAAHNYVQTLAANNGAPDVETMGDFEKRRQAAITAGLNELRQGISE